MKDVGVLDLTKHLIYVNKEMGNEKLDTLAISTLSFNALGYSYKYGIVCLNKK